MVRALLGVFAGIAVSMALIYLVQRLGHGIFPPPVGLDPGDPEAFATALRGVPPMALVVVLAAYALGTFGGAWLAARVAGRPFYAFLVGGVMTLAGAASVMAQPLPLWFTVSAVLVFLPSAWLASRLAITG